MGAVLSRCRTEEGCRIAVVRYPTGLHLEPHAHDFTTFSMVLRGGLREEVGASAVTAGVFDLVVKPRGTRHANLFLSDHTTLVQVTPSDETVRHAVEAGCPLRRWGWTDGTAAARPLARLAGLAPRSDAEVDTAELQAAVDEALAALGIGDVARASGSPPAWLRRAREALEEAADRGAAPPSIAYLAEDAGVHRVHLSREFHRWFGVSPTEYRLRSRLRDAARRLGCAEGSLSATAYRSGYSDQAHMTREFRRHLGLTPLEYRRLLAPFAA